MIPEWIWRLPFMQRERVKIFAAAQKDVLETMKDDIDRQAEELAKEKLSNLLTIIDPRMIVSFSKSERAIYIGGECAEDSKLANLKSEAEAITQMEIWQLLFHTPNKLAQKALFEDDGKSDIVHAKGRAIIYTLDTQQRILDIFKSYTHPPDLTVQ